MECLIITHVITPWTYRPYIDAVSEDSRSPGHIQTERHLQHRIPPDIFPTVSTTDGMYECRRTAFPSRGMRWRVPGTVSSRESSHGGEELTGHSRHVQMTTGLMATGTDHWWSEMTDDMIETRANVQSFRIHHSITHRHRGTLDNSNTPCTSTDHL